MIHCKYFSERKAYTSIKRVRVLISYYLAVSRTGFCGHPMIEDNYATTADSCWHLHSVSVSTEVRYTSHECNRVVLNHSA